MLKKINGLFLKERKIANDFLSIELPKYFKIRYPSQGIQNIFKLNVINNELRKKK